MANFDISTHNLVPKHIKLNETEAQNVLQNYNISIRQLPKISSKDPMVKMLNAKAGDIIKIIRKSPTAGETIFYRAITNE